MSHQKTAVGVPLSHDAQIRNIIRTSYSEAGQGNVDEWLSSSHPTYHAVRLALLAAPVGMQLVKANERKPSYGNIYPGSVSWQIVQHLTAHGPQTNVELREFIATITRCTLSTVLRNCARTGNIVGESLQQGNHNAGKLWFLPCQLDRAELILGRKIAV